MVKVQVTDRLQRDVLQTSSAFWTQAVESPATACSISPSESITAQSRVSGPWQRRLAECSAT